MKLRTVWLLAAVLVLIGTTGCGAEPATPEAAAATAGTFLQARAEKNASVLYSLVTERVQQSLTRTDMSQFLRRERFSYGQVGVPEAVGETWIQVSVTNVRLETEDVQTTWPEYQLRLRHDGKRWRVAWVDPLAAAALSAYQNTRYGDQLELARAISEVDPYHYRGPLEQHYAYRGLKRLREAELAALQAGELALPSQASAVDEALARFRLSAGSPTGAVSLARTALQKAAPYIPELYSHRWQADTMALLARAQLAAGDRSGAAETVRQAAAIDPQNAGLAILRREME